MLLRFLSYGNISLYFSIANSLFGNNNPYKILRNRRCSRMLIILIRTIVLYFIILFVMRVMGKAELSKMSPFQMIVSFMIAELAAMPIESAGHFHDQWGHGHLYTVVSAGAHFPSFHQKRTAEKSIQRLSQHTDRKRQDQQKEMKRLRLTISDLLEALRIGGRPWLSRRRICGQWNATGTFLIIQKAQEKPTYPCTISSIAKSPESMPLVLISDGQLLPSEPASLRMDGNADGQRASGTLSLYHSVAVKCFSRSVMNRVAFTSTT